MGMIEELATYLDSNSTKLTAGTNLFVNALPPSTRAVLALWESPSLPPAHTFGNDTLPAYTRASVQLIGRTSAPTGGATIPYSTTARVLMHEALVLLNRVTNQGVPTSTGTYYLRVEQQQEPFRVPEPEDDGSLLYSCNLEVWRTPSTAYE